MTLDPHDARLTAYAIGELDAREAALVEAELGQSPEAARAVVEIRHAAELLRQALKAEQAVAAPAELPAAARAKIYAAAESANGEHASAVANPFIAARPRPVAPRQRLAGWLRRHKAVVSVVAVAVVAVGAILPALQPAREAGSRRTLALVDSSDSSKSVALDPRESDYQISELPPQREMAADHEDILVFDTDMSSEQSGKGGGEGQQNEQTRPGGKPGDSYPSYTTRGPQDFSSQGPEGSKLSSSKSGEAEQIGGQDRKHAGDGQALAPSSSQDSVKQWTELRKGNDDKSGAGANEPKSQKYDSDPSKPSGRGIRGEDKAGKEVEYFGDSNVDGTVDSGKGGSTEGQEEDFRGKAIVNGNGIQTNSKGSGSPSSDSKPDADLQATKHHHEGDAPVDSLNKIQKPAGYVVENTFESEARENLPNTEDYARIVENTFQSVGEQPLSTFSIDVDTASYSIVRRFLNQASLPPPSAVRIEELINYFHYSYSPPKEDAADPFAAHADVVACPWAPNHRLVRIGVKGREIDADKRPACNLVFLIDVSGSMKNANKLPLVKEGLRMLVEKLGENDSVAIVVYAGASGLVLPSTNGTQKSTIIGAIDKLEAGGSTNGASGIQLAYETAVGSFIKEGANRVILATDGDFNVGVTNQGQLVDLIEQKAKSGVFLSVLGFGMGNLKDSTLEKLSDKGNGNYAYIDSQAEARKVLVEQLSGTLVTIAKDVKIQIEFNPAKVQAYRLIGYENRMLAKEDFNDDKKDAGEIGAGHTVTALYEVVPTGAPVAAAEKQIVDRLEYQDPPAVEPKPAPVAEAAAKSKDLLMLKLRYKAPDGETSKLLKYPVVDNNQSIGAAGDDCEFAAAVAAFGMQLRSSAYKGTVNYSMILELAESGVGEDKEGYRREFVELVKKAQATGR